MHVDFKETVWSRVEVPSEKEEETLKLLKEGKINDANDLCSHLGASNDYTMLLDTSEQMTPEDKQDGFSTIEVHKDGEILFENGE